MIFKNLKNHFYYFIVGFFICTFSLYAKAPPEKKGVFTCAYSDYKKWKKEIDSVPFKMSVPIDKLISFMGLEGMTFKQVTIDQEPLKKIYKKICSHQKIEEPMLKRIWKRISIRRLLYKFYEFKYALKFMDRLKEKTNGYMVSRCHAKKKEICQMVDILREEIEYEDEIEERIRKSEEKRKKNHEKLKKLLNQR